MKKNITKSKAQKQGQVVSLQQETSSYQGPIPQAAEMQQYQSIDNSFPDRLLKMAEKEQDAAHEDRRKGRENEERKQQHEERAQQRGQHYAFILVLVCLLLSGLVVYWDPTNYKLAILLVILAVGPSGVVRLYNSTKGNENKPK